MRDRVDSLGVAEPELQRSGSDQIEVSLPGVKNAERAADQVGTTAQLYFYDWEPNILDEDCKTNPERGQRRPAADLRALQRGQARVEVPAGDRRQQHRPTAPLLRVRQDVARSRSTTGIPDETKPRSTEDLRRRRPVTDKAEILEVPEGVIVLRADDDRDPEAKRGELDQLVGAQGQPGPRRHRHQEPGAGLRGRLRRRADRHDGVHRQGPQGVRRRPPARSPSAAPTTRRSTAACRTRSTPRTTSRSGSTTS